MPPARGSWTVSIDAAGARALTAAIMGLTGDVPPAAIADTLREAIRQVVERAVAAGRRGRRRRCAPATWRPHAAIPMTEPCTALAIACGALTLAVSVCGEIDVHRRGAAGQAPATRSRAQSPGWACPRRRSRSGSTRFSTSSCRSSCASAAPSCRFVSWRTWGRDRSSTWDARPTTRSICWSATASWRAAKWWWSEATTEFACWTWSVARDRVRSMEA